MSMQNQVEAAIKTTIGASGTTLSLLLDNVSVVVSIIAGLATAAYMFQQWRNARYKGNAFKEDRENENT